jgi:transposase
MKKGNKIYLCEYQSIREGKNVRSKFIRYLGVESDQEKVPLPKKTVMDWKPPDRSVRAGDVAVLWSIASKMQMVETIDRICGLKGRRKANSPGKLLTLWAINRVLDPESATQLEDWVEGTSLPELSKLSPKGADRDAFLAALDCICCEEPASGRIVNKTNAIDEALYAIWRNQNPLPKDESEFLAYDMTSMITYGSTCPLAEKGHNAENWRQQQFNLSLLVSKYDKQPLGHMIHPGNHTSMTTMQHVIPRLYDFSIQNGTIIWDRGNTSNKTVNALEKMGWKVICGVPKISDDAKTILMGTDIPEGPDTLVPCKNTGELYAYKIQAELYGQKRETVVYLNVTKATKSLIRRNKAIYVISQELVHLKSELKFNSQKDLKSAVKGILNGWKRFFSIEYPEDENVVDFSWSVNEKRVSEARSMDGKFLLYSSDNTYTAQEVVKMYLEKDFIEKAFRTIKADEDLKPIRHRLESRVRAIIFVCTLAYRLLSALRWMINSSNSKDVTLSESIFLKKLARVEKLEVDLGKEIEVFYVNVTTDLKKQVIALGMTDLFAGRRFLVE